MSTGKCHIGTSGWAYAHWAKGRFYPKGMKQRDWLPYFAEHFSTVEINASFYRLPKEEMVTRWRTVTGSDFHFAVKMWRRITHLKRLVNCGEDTKTFLAIVNELGPKRGPLLVQLPPSMHVNVERLDAFLADLKSAMGRKRWKVTVEFRNTEWLCKPVYQILNRYGAALCLADMERCPITEPNDVDFVYVRRHGPGGRYRGRYSARHIAKDAVWIRDWLFSGKEVFVYYNNDVEGHAIDNARQLIDAVGCG